MKSFLSKDIFLFELRYIITHHSAPALSCNIKHTWKRDTKTGQDTAKAEPKQEEDKLLPERGFNSVDWSYLGCKELDANQKTVLCKEKAVKYARRVWLNVAYSKNMLSRICSSNSINGSHSVIQPCFKVRNRNLLDINKMKANTGSLQYSTNVSPTTGLPFDG